MRILAVADEVHEPLYSAAARPTGIDLALACGDLPFEYLEFLVTVLNVPLAYVPGNHDPALKARAIPTTDYTRPFFWTYVEPPERPGPEGCINLDGKIMDLAGLRIAGLGGSRRYREGPNQYTEAQMRYRAWRLLLKNHRGAFWNHPPVDVLLTHAPPRAAGDGDDPAHRGFETFHDLVARLSPRLLLHGHIHPYGLPQHEHTIGETRVINVVPYKVIELDAREHAAVVREEA